MKGRKRVGEGYKISYLSPLICFLSPVTCHPSPLTYYLLPLLITYYHLPSTSQILCQRCPAPWQLLSHISYLSPFTSNLRFSYLSPLTFTYHLLPLSYYLFPLTHPLSGLTSTAHSLLAAVPVPLPPPTSISAPPPRPPKYSMSETAEQVQNNNKTTYNPIKTPQ